MTLGRVRCAPRGPVQNSMKVHTAPITMILGPFREKLTVKAAMIVSHLSEAQSSFFWNFLPAPLCIYSTHTCMYTVSYYAYTCMFIYICIDTCIHIYVFVYVYIYIYVYMNIYIQQLYVHDCLWLTVHLRLHVFNQEPKINQRKLVFGGGVI